MLVRNAFEADFLEIISKSREWGDLVVEREGIYHIMTLHFRSTCFVAEDRGHMIGYLLGFISQSDPGQAHMHLIQVDPALRGHGVGRRLFGMFESNVRGKGCKKIVSLSRPENKTAMSFYVDTGMENVSSGNTIDVGGVRAVKDYNGPGKHMVMWSKEL